jgi:hypothetical protein
VFRLVIIGCGPAGLAPLLAAHRNGQLDALLSGGVAVVEASGAMGGGALGDYAISSDSTGTTFVDCLQSASPSALTALQTHPLTVEVAQAGDGPVALALAGRFLALVGQTIHAILAAHPDCAVFTHHRACLTQRVADGWTTTIEDAVGRQKTLSSRFVSIAAGAHQPLSRLAAETVFTGAGLAAVSRQLAALAEPRVAVIGGSTSAAAIASALLRDQSIRFSEAGVTILHRRELRIYYPSVQDALDDGYTEFSDADICPISGRVFRFAGFRLDSRELIMRARGIGGRPAEPRLALHRLRPHDSEAISILDRADLVIAALGYRPRALPVVDAAGRPLALHAHTAPAAPLVDGNCAVLDAAGRPIPGLFAIGLAAGFVPRGRLGGEPSFSGQANGLWLWQNDVGMLIVRAVLAQMPRVASARFARRKRDAGYLHAQAVS